MTTTGHKQRLTCFSDPPFPPSRSHSGRPAARAASLEPANQTIVELEPPQASETVSLRKYGMRGHKTLSGR